MILEMPWLACHNPEIDWRTGKVKMTRCPEECRKQWRPKQGKLGWQKQKKEERKGEAGRRQEEKKQKKRKRTMEVKKVAEEWEIWDEEEAAAKLEEEAKRLVSEHFHKWIQVFGKKASEQIPTRKP